MKHQTITLLKFKTLAASLKRPLWQVIGILEGLWLFAIHHARDGDLSRFSAADIGVWLEFDGDADSLINALVQTGWLDRQGDVLVIHDWVDHRPTWLKGIAARQLSSELGSDSEATKSGTKSSTKSPTKSDTKSATKQVGLGLVGLGTKSNTLGTSRERRFKKPTAAQVQAYCEQRQNGITGEEFVDHYVQIGWVVGKNQSPMKDWKAAVRTWEQRRKTKPAESRVATAADLENFDLENFDLVTGTVR